MVRFVIIGIVIAVAFTLYALVDAAMTDSSRARGVSKPLWVVIVAVLPVVGAILWFTIGKGTASMSAPRPKPSAPDDDPRFTGGRISDAELDAHMRDLEDRLRELDDEVYPGEDRRGSAPSSDTVPGGPAGGAAPPEAGSHRTPPRDPARESAVDPDAEPEDRAETGSAPEPDADPTGDEGDHRSGGDSAQR